MISNINPFNLTTNKNQKQDEFLTDLVVKGILPKEISKFTEDDLGLSIFLPYNDVKKRIPSLLEFEILGINSHTPSYSNKTIKNTLTLMSKNVICYGLFDAKEPNNPDTNLVNNGCPIWKFSNMRQWLNSDNGPGEWYSDDWASKQGYIYDAPPISGNSISYQNFLTYMDQAGFLNGFPSYIREHLTKVQVQSYIGSFYPELFDDEFYTTDDYVFIPSLNEMGMIYDTNRFKVGNFFDKRFSLTGTGNESRIFYGWYGSSTAGNNYFTRDIYESDYAKIVCIAGGGGKTTLQSANTSVGIVPILVLH